ncbi:MAG: exodeoxyribonuclease VII large subunit [Chloroflexi bacterium]|nr:exodeoxyribonuclease VII large subunit [Chloroflexota bacterium]
MSDDRPWERWLREPPRAAVPEPDMPRPATPASPPVRPPAVPGPTPKGSLGGPVVRPGATVASRIWSVADVTRAVRDLLRAEPAFRDLWIEGEVGQVTVSAAGHCYFTLRDARSQVACVFFRTQRMTSPFEVRTGLRVVAHGRLDVYDAGGAYQLYVESVQPAGFGDLALRFEALKARLAAEGLFDAAKRRPVPPSPHLIGVATSASGAVLHDIRHVLGRRWPLVRAVLAACQVQGDAAPPTIVAALRRLAEWRDPETGAPPDVILLARGGGSLEDLWAFNDERVVRAVAASPIPVVAGVGHETDVTLVDFAADVRAPTPSAAAELVVPSRAEAAAALRAARTRLAAGAMRSVAGPRAVLAGERRALERAHPLAIVAGERMRAGDLLDRARRASVAHLAMDRARLGRASDRLPLVVTGRVARARADLSSAAAGLAALSPYATLERGYAIVRDADGRVLRDAADTGRGRSIDVRLARGELDATVTRVRDSGR